MRKHWQFFCEPAISFITSLSGKALQWGKDFINGIADGIRSAIGNVVSAVSDMVKRAVAGVVYAEKILKLEITDDFLHGFLYNKGQKSVPGRNVYHERRVSDM